MIWYVLSLKCKHRSQGKEGERKALTITWRLKDKAKTSKFKTERRYNLMLSFILEYSKYPLALTPDGQILIHVL